MAALVLRPGCSLDGSALFQHVEQLLPPYAWPRFLRLQERLEMTETFKQQKVRLAQEGFDPTAVPDPLFLLDEGSKAYVPLGPAQWERVLDGSLRI
ncbi:S27A3 protein, partial [Eolophus roseicapillus]|nr:S27A3 protein [Eolophus roseicapilla]